MSPSPPPQQPPSLARPFDCVADVCLQLCAHHLPVRALLQWARCSRRCLRTMDSPLSWRCAQPMRLESVHTAWAPRPSQLLRRATLSVLLRASSSDGLSDLDLRSLFALADACPIVSLHLSFPNKPQWHDNYSIRRFLRIYVHPSLAASLQSLTVERAGRIWESEMAHCTQLPRLHTLALRHSRPVGGVHWIASMHSLTDLELSDLDEASVEPSRCLQAVMRCTRLKRLSFVSPQLIDRHFARFFQSNSIQQLQELKLTSVQLGGYDGSPSADEFAQAMRSMVQLRSLHLHQVGYIDALLPHLRLPPLLTQLTLEAHLVDTDEIAEESVPSVHVLLTLLLIARTLSCTLLLPFHSPLSPVKVSRNLRSQWGTLANAAEWAELGSRMRIQRDVMPTDR